MQKQLPVPLSQGFAMPGHDEPLSWIGLWVRWKVLVRMLGILPQPVHKAWVVSVILRGNRDRGGFVIDGSSHTGSLEVE